MKQRLTIGLLLLLTFLFTVALLAFNPFERANRLLDAVFHAAPAWTQVTNVYRNPQTQEDSWGEKPMESFRTMAEYWRQSPGVRRIVFVGNSQMLTVSLAPGEPPPAGPEKTYIDQVTDWYRQGKPSPAVGYRIAALGLSFTEALWNLLYLSLSPSTKPDDVVLQLNYQSFWNGGIRQGMLELLEDPQFRQVIEQQSQENTPHASVLREALRDFDKGKAKAVSSKQNSLEPVARPGISLNYAWGEAWDREVRSWLQPLRLYRKRALIKDSLVDMLYRLRIYVLQMKPSTARSISGARLLRSNSSIEAIGRLCQSQGIRLYLFNAPINPQVSLYRTDAERQSYRVFIERMARDYQVSVLDLENSIAAPLWGQLLNTPDPIHLGRVGHQKLTGLLVDMLQKKPVSRP